MEVSVISISIGESLKTSKKSFNTFMSVLCLGKLLSVKELYLNSDISCHFIFQNSNKVFVL